MMEPVASNNFTIVGILLAAGKGVRFDPSGRHDKLTQRLPSGEFIATASANNMLAVLPRVVAVVRPGAEALATHLSALGCEVVTCADAESGMANSLVHAITHTAEAAAWIIGLADMPYVQTSTIAALADAIHNGADIAVPVYQGKRGNPVAIRRVHLPRLLALTGDEGARSLLKTFPVVEVAVSDAGVRQDIDVRADLDGHQ